MMGIESFTKEMVGFEGFAVNSMIDQNAGPGLSQLGTIAKKNHGGEPQG
jgi:hypothetical protein